MVNRNRIVILFVIALNSACLRQNNSTQDQAQANSRAPNDRRPIEVLKGAGVNLLRSFLDMAEGNLVINSAVNLPIAFFQDTTPNALAANFLNESEWMTLRETQKQTESALLKCSAWFDTFIRGEQRELKIQGRIVLGQFRVCTGPSSDSAGPFTNRIAKDTALTSITNFCLRALPGEHRVGHLSEWLMLRDFHVEQHALVIGHTSMQKCGPWTEAQGGLASIDHLGTNYQYSFSRKCEFLCNGLSKTVCGKTNRIEWTEVAQFPTLDYVTKSEPQSLSCASG